MIKNQNGSALLLVLLMVVVLSVLGLTLMANTINDKKQTVARESDIVSIHQARKALEEGIALIKAEFVDNYDAELITPSEHTSNVQDFLDRFTEVNGEYFYNNGTSNVPSLFHIIEDIPKNEFGQPLIDTTRDLSRKFVIKSRAVDKDGRTREFKQDIYLSAIPSFLYFAVGSRDNLYLQGSPTIKGNIYANKGLYVKNKANFEINGIDSWVEDTLFPFATKSLEATIENSELVLEENIEIKVNDSLKNIASSDFFEDNVVFHKDSKIKFGNFDFANDVDIERTFVDKINEQLSAPSMVISDLIDPNFFINLANNSSNIKSFTSISDLDDIYKNDHTPVHLGNFLINENVEIPVDNWLIIDGDLIIQALEGESIIIDGNILVTGNIAIIGDGLKFDSAIFALGRADIFDADISSIDDNKTLILMAKEGLEVARMNEFQATSTDKIKAFLYTESAATLYGVGSRIYIEGGVFAGLINNGTAQGSLTINAVRGNVGEGVVVPDQQALSNDESSSRFIVEHNRKIITSKANFSKAYNGLPRTGKLSIIVDRPNIN